ncbi:MAG: beta-N-acetylhexosaminidase [bacterium]
MTSTRKEIASLCVFGFEGTTVPPTLRRLIEKEGLAGVILFKRNIESKEQVAELNRELQSLSPDGKLLISVDHEGGRVFRLPPPFTQIPAARRIGEEEKGFETGVLMGQELKEVGFNLNYAPVLDVDSNPANPIIGDRAYGSDPETVARIALEVVRGLRSEGIFPCGKHFPGHGDTFRDSHLELPFVDQPLSRLEAIELKPFQAAIQDGIEMLMTAHVVYPALDPDFPATLSKKIITELLRDKMGYEGVVISDDLLMKAIYDREGVSKAAELFLQAGGDLVLICRQEEEQGKTLEALEKSARDGILPEKCLRASIQRVLKLKQKMGNL